MPFNRIKNSLGLERNILVMLSSILILGMGEELWLRFVPKYLELPGSNRLDDCHLRHHKRFPRCSLPVSRGMANRPAGSAQVPGIIYCAGNYWLRYLHPGLELDPDSFWYTVCDVLVQSNPACDLCHDR